MQLSDVVAVETRQMNAGKWLIVGIFAVAIGSGIASWMHRYYRTDAVQAFWGEQSLDRMANAPKVEALRLSADSIIDRRDATRGRGMLNVRYMLGSDFAYAWPASEPAEPFARAWGLKFVAATDVFQIEFSGDCLYARQPETGKGIRLVPPAAANLHAFFADLFEKDAANADELDQTAK